MIGCVFRDEKDASGFLLKQQVGEFLNYSFDYNLIIVINLDHLHSVIETGLVVINLIDIVVDVDYFQHDWKLSAFSEYS